MKKPSPSLVPMMCIACKTILPGIIKCAKKHGINCIIMGGNPYEYTSFKKELLNVSRDQSYESTSSDSLRHKCLSFMWLAGRDVEGHPKRFVAVGDF